MKKMTLAAVAALSLWMLPTQPASAQFSGGISCDQICSLSADHHDQACCLQGLDGCDATFSECVEDQRVAAGEVCSQIDQLQQAAAEALKLGDDVKFQQASKEAFCCEAGYFPGTASYECCLATSHRLVGRTCPKEAPLPPPAIAPICGNTILEPGEACDDGNQVDNDGCSLDCKTPGQICFERFQDDNSPDYYCCVDQMNAGLPAQGCPVPPTPPSEPTPEEPQTPLTPVDPETPPAPIAEEPSVSEGSLTCEVARDEDVGPGGKVIAVSRNGLVPFVIRYSNPSAVAALSLELRQSEGLPVAITDLNAGSESIAGKSLASALAAGGEAQWVVYLSRPSSLVGDWDPDASFEVTVKDALTSDEIAKLETACLAAAHVQGGQGGCALAGPGQDRSVGPIALVIFAAGILMIFRSRKNLPVGY